MEEILLSASPVLTELTTEFVRRAYEELGKDPRSQTMACLFLATRSASLLCGMGRLLSPETRDSFEVMTRAFLEARDLLMTFRFDEKGTRRKIVYWFDGKADSSWKPEHKKCNKFWEKRGYFDTEFGKKWSQMTAFAHSSVYAANNSTVCAALFAADPPRVEDFREMMESKVADYLANIATLIVNATVDLPGLVSLGCDLQRMPNIHSFRANVVTVVGPILKNVKNDLPPGSFRED
jgi:hypothetical protein